MVEDSAKRRKLALAKEERLVEKNELLIKEKRRKKQLLDKLSSKAKKKQNKKFPKWLFKKPKTVGSVTSAAKKRVNNVFQWKDKGRRLTIGEKRQTLIRIFWSLFGLKYYEGIKSPHPISVSLAVLTRFAHVWLCKVEKEELILARDDFSDKKDGLRKLSSLCCCFVCGRKAQQRHHIILLLHGGNNKKSNIIWLCDECHGYLHPWIQGATIWMNKIDKETSLDFCLLE